MNINSAATIQAESLIIGIPTGRSIGLVMLNMAELNSDCFED